MVGKDGLGRRSDWKTMREGEGKETSRLLTIQNTTYEAVSVRSSFELFFEYGDRGESGETTDSGLRTRSVHPREKNNERKAERLIYCIVKS